MVNPSLQRVIRLAQMNKQGDAVDVLLKITNPQLLSRIWGLYMDQPMLVTNHQAMAIESITRIKRTPSLIKSFLDAILQASPRVGPEIEKIRTELVKPSENPTRGVLLPPTARQKLVALISLIFSSGKALDLFTDRYLNTSLGLSQLSLRDAAETFVKWLYAHPNQVMPTKNSMLKDFPRRSSDIEQAFS